MEKEMITFTTAAREKLQELKGSQSSEGEQFVRIGSRGGGCGVAVTYYIGFDKAEPDDQIFTFNEIDCVIQKGQLLQLHGLNINWLETESQQGFQFTIAPAQ